jgi:hypothetical protein
MQDVTVEYDVQFSVPYPVSLIIVMTIGVTFYSMFRIFINIKSAVASGVAVCIVAIVLVRRWKKKHSDEVMYSPLTPM